MRSKIKSINHYFWWRKKGLGQIKRLNFLLFDLFCNLSGYNIYFFFKQNKYIIFCLQVIEIIKNAYIHNVHAGKLNNES